MTSIKRLVPISALAVSLAAGACKDTTSPAAVDPGTMATTLNGLSTAFSGNAAFQSLSALSGKFTLTAAVAAAQVAPSGGAWAASPAARYDVMHPLADRSPAVIMALFPANVLGKTFQWDTAAGGHYRITDSTLAGASASGVRFFLYVVIPGTKKPLLPLQKLGYVDLSDVSTPQANVIHLVVQFGSQTIADYAITGVRTTTSLTLTASGSVTDGVTPVNFTLTHALRLTDSSLTTSYQLTGNGATVSLHTTASASGGTTTSTIDWSMQKNGSVEVVGTTTAAAINVQFKLDGVTWATVGGTPSAPTFTAATGQSLTPAQLIALGQILSGFGEIFDSLDAVFGPSFLVFS
jgi:hypothetical protein